MNNHKTASTVASNRASASYPDVEVREAVEGRTRPVLVRPLPHGRQVASGMETSTPVLVLNAKTYGTLGILRSLGRLGVPVYIAECDPQGSAAYSRYCRARFVWDFSNGASTRKLAEQLLRLGDRIGRRSILIPTWDEAAQFVADEADLLRQAFIFPNQPAEVARSLASKKEMHFLAKKAGIPTAEAAFPVSRTEVCAFARQASFPVMLKGIDGNRLHARCGTKMVIVHNAQELLHRYERMEDPDCPNLMLQEYIPGGDDTIWMFNGYFDDRSDCLAGFTGKKIRQYPVYTGATSLGICLRNDIVETTTKRWMKALGYRGILDIGYRYDARDGQYKVLDANPRIGATFRLFVAQNGMDVVRALYLDLTGQPVPPIVSREGRKWMIERDLESCLRYHRDGKLSIWQWLKSLRGIEEMASFALDDLRPLWYVCHSAIFSR